MVEESKIKWPPAAIRETNWDDVSVDMEISPPVTRAPSPFTLHVPCTIWA